MTDPIFVDDYKAAVRTCYLAAKMLAQHDLKHVIAAINRAETVGPIVDPTLYREKSGHMAEDKRVVEAALALRNIGLELEEIADARGQ